MRLKQVETAGSGKLLDRARGRPQAPARRAVRLRQHQGDIMACVEQRAKRARRKFWSAGEN
jgi:hypothetical protein